MVLECTGAHLTRASLAPYFAKGVRKVVVSAPVKDEPAVLNIVMGVNHVRARRSASPPEHANRRYKRPPNARRPGDCAAQNRSEPRPNKPPETPSPRDPGRRRCTTRRWTTS